MTDFDCDICGNLCDEVYTQHEGNTFICFECEDKEKLKDDPVNYYKNKTDQLKKRLFFIKEDYNDRLNQIIQNGADVYDGWVERQQAIDDCLNTLRKKIWEEISDDIEQN